MFKLLVALSLSLCFVVSVMAQQSPAGTPVAVLSGGIGEESARDLMPRRGAYNVRFSCLPCRKVITLQMLR